MWYFVSRDLAALCNSHFNFLMQEVGLKIRGALVTTIYRRTLTVSSIELSKFRLVITERVFIVLVLDP